jgi:hypothetical protein
MGFKAAEHVEALEYTFEPYAPVSGTIPEPNDIEVNRFIRRWYKLVGDAQSLAMVQIQAAKDAEDAGTEEAEPAVVSVDELVASMDTWDSNSEDGEKLARAMAQLVEDLSRGQLSVDTLMSVPYRPRAQFFGWLVGELSSSGKGSVGTSNALRAV